VRSMPATLRSAVPSQGYLPEQLFVTANPLTVPLWVTEVWFYLLAPSGRTYRYGRAEQGGQIGVTWRLGNDHPKQRHVSAWNIAPRI